MDQLSTNTARIIVNFWKSGKKPMDSKDIYDLLLSEGETIKDGDMQNIFDSLLKQVFIRGRYHTTSEGAKTHGALRIGWVNPVLIEIFDT
ncbi:MAG TPA: hypothetical protein VF131_24995 [Blastocatellia bacterium]|jgi:hypothetical protein|nr:hypothetical protein [Blastocatellia bacterium]